MKVVVPTFRVRAILREEVTIQGHAFKPGAVVTMAYGVALQALSRGVVGAIVNADKAHDEALMALATYGGDAWFPTNLQTIGRLVAAFEQAEKEAPSAVKH